MANSYQRMRRSNKKTKEFMKFFGYDIDTIVHTRHSKDLWYLWDGVGLSRLGEVLWIQVKTNGYPSKHDRERMQEFCERYRQRAVFISWFDRVKSPKTWWFEPSNL